MNFPSVRNRLAALLLGAALLAPAMAQTVLALPAAQAPGGDVRQALTVPPGGTLRLERLTLDEASGEVASADLRRTNAGSSAPLLVVHSGSEVTTTRPAPRAHFTGQLVGDPKSSVFVSIDEQGALRSIVRRGEEVFVSDIPAPSTPGAAGTASLAAPSLRARRVEHLADAPAQPFMCGVDDEFVEKNHVPPSAALLQNLRDNHQRAGLLGVASRGAEALGALRRADIIIETDYELFQRLGSKSAVYAYVTDLLGYVSSQYESEIGARLNVTQINAYDTPADPWTGSTNNALLDELQAYWNASSRFSQPRHHVHLLSGRDTGGGIAYVDTLDTNYRNYAYGVSGSIEGSFSASNPQVVWDAVAVAHEMGHAFGSSHTHRYDNPELGSNQGGAIDCCYSESGGAQCTNLLGGTNRNGQLPGVNSISGGSAGTGAGTIMSYCNLLPGYINNISFNFGTNHTRGVNPWRVASVLQSSAQTYLPLDTVVQNYTLSVSRQGTGSGTVTSSPAGISCGSTCSASYAAGTSVTLSAQPASGSTFGGWGGACSGTSSCTVSMDSARSVTASFTSATTTRTVTLGKSGTGTGSVTSSPAGLSCGTTCSSTSASFASTTPITLTAQAASGSTFAGWGGACSGTSSSCTIAAGTAAANVTASFNTSTGGSTVTPLAQTNLSGALGSLQYFSVAVPAGATNLSIETSGGTGDVDLYVRFGQSPTRSLYDCLSGNYGNAERCAASTPTAGTYYIMLDGYEAFSGLTLTASYQTTTTQNHTLTVARQGTGSGTVTSSPTGINCGSTCSASYAAGSSVTLRALPATGSTFGGWGGACSGASSSCTVSMSAARNVTASFNIGGGSGPLADPAVFVTQQYRDFLGRSPASAALNNWVNQLNAGTATRAQVIQTLMNSTEFQGRFGPLVRLYTAYFRRVPDYGGLMYWFNAMYPSSGGGTSLAQVSQAFAQSQEFIGTYGALDNAGFVNLVYQNVLGRTAEPAGFTYWLGELNRGMSRGQMMIGFSESAENQANTANSQGITLAHVGMLKRSPNSSEHDRWLVDMNAGRANLLSLINSLLQSSEYAARF